MGKAVYTPSPEALLGISKAAMLLGADVPSLGDFSATAMPSAPLSPDTSVAPE